MTTFLASCSGNSHRVLPPHQRRRLSQLFTSSLSGLVKADGHRAETHDWIASYLADDARSKCTHAPLEPRFGGRKASFLFC
jgi:hypothetical protein